MKKWVWALAIGLVAATLIAAPFLDEEFADASGGWTLSEMEELVKQYKDSSE